LDLKAVEEEEEEAAAADLLLRRFLATVMAVAAIRATAPTATESSSPTCWRTTPRFLAAPAAR